MSRARLARALRAVAEERRFQEEKGAQKRREGKEWVTCADPAMSNYDKLAVLMEEVGEVAHEMTEALIEKRIPSYNLRGELIQVAAVAVAWAESLECA